jgi:hypothetical protein
MAMHARVACLLARKTDVSEMYTSFAFHSYIICKLATAVVFFLAWLQSVLHFSNC